MSVPSDDGPCPPPALHAELLFDVPQREDELRLVAGVLLHAPQVGVDVTRPLPGAQLQETIGPLDGARKARRIRCVTDGGQCLVVLTAFSSQTQRVDVLHPAVGEIERGLDGRAPEQRRGVVEDRLVQEASRVDHEDGAGTGSTDPANALSQTRGRLRHPHQHADVEVRDVDAEFEGAGAHHSAQRPLREPTLDGLPVFLLQPGSIGEHLVIIHQGRLRMGFGVGPGVDFPCPLRAARRLRIAATLDDGGDELRLLAAVDEGDETPPLLAGEGVHELGHGTHHVRA